MCAARMMLLIEMEKGFMLCAVMAIGLFGCECQMSQSFCDNEYFGYSLTSARFDLSAQNLDVGNALHVTAENVKDSDVYEIVVPPCQKPVKFTSQKICVAGPKREIVGVQAVKRCLNDEETKASFQSIVNYLVQEKRLNMNKNVNGCRADFSGGGITVSVVATVTNEIVVVCANEFLLEKYNIPK